MYWYFDHAILYINGHDDDFFIGKETKTKTWPKLAHFIVQVNCRKEGIKDLSIILAVYGPRNWIIFAIYCPRIEWESFSLFMRPDMDLSDEFWFWILGPEISRMVQILAPESVSLFWLYKWPWTTYALSMPFTIP